jgi:rod shape-determining protein MreC
MRRRTKIHINPKHLLFIFIVLCIGLIFLSYRYGGKLTPVRNVVGSVITPMQKGINTVGGFVSDKLDTFTSMNDLLEENNRLQNQVNILSYENKLLLQDKYELDELRELYELDQKYLDYPKVAARVISKDPGNWYNVFTIDKGSKDGFKEGMNVLAGNGLAGIITEVYYNYSKVRSIIDDKSNVSGMFLKTSDTCIVEGDLELMDEGKIRVGLISKDAEIEEGYEVVTSHISDKYLQGILIGYVSDIKLDPSNMTRTAYLTPVVDFERLEEVLVITELKEPLLDKDPALTEESAEE